MAFMISSFGGIAETIPSLRLECFDRDLASVKGGTRRPAFPAQEHLLSGGEVSIVRRLVAPGYQ
jgi:hypothetical protein